MLPTGPVLGGAPCNVAIRLAELGHEVRIVSRVGDDDLGRRARKILKARGVQTDLLQTDPHHPTGTVEVRVEAGGLPTYDIRRDVAYDHVSLTPQARDAISRADGLCFGTLAQRDTHAHPVFDSFGYAPPGAAIYYDVNVRPGQVAESRVALSVTRATILKVSREELPEVSDILGIGTTEPGVFAERVVSRYGLAFCVVTLDHEGALGVDSHGQTTRHPGFPTNVVDTVGAGDAFSAGFLSAYLTGESLAACIRRGNQLGALVAGVSGGTTPLDPWSISPDSLAQK